MPSTATPPPSSVARFADHGEVSTAYEMTGQGPALLLMHGAEATRQMFADLVPWLAPSFTVIAYDQRHCGATRSPARPATLSELAQDAADLLRGLGFERAHVFGSSFGGRVAQAFALRHPERLDRLVLGSTWPLPASMAELNPDGVARIAQLRARLPDSAEALAALFFTEPFLLKRPELRGFFAKVKPTDDIAKWRAAAVASGIDADLSRIGAPTLVLTGDADAVLPPGIALSLAERIPDSRTQVLSGVGHATAMQAPERLAAALCAFLHPEATPCP